MTPYTGYQPMPTPMPFGPPPPPMPVPRRARRRTAIVLGVFAALLFLTAGAFAGLYVLSTGDHDAVAERLEDRRGELATVSDRLAASEDERVDAEQRNSDLETTRTDLTACVDAVKHYLWDVAPDSPEDDAAFDTFFAACQ